MKVLTSTLLTLILFFSSTVFAQGDGLSSWMDHLPYNKTRSVAITDDRVYAATPYSLYYYDKEDNSLERITKINGLSDTDISEIGYNSVADALVIAYRNTNIDIYKNGEYINLPDIKRFSIPGNKSINKITFIDKYAYLACGFGIVIIDLDRVEVSATYYIGPEGSYINVNDIAFDAKNEMIYAATELGVFYADFNAPNLAHFEFWNRLTGYSNENEETNVVEVIGDNVVFNSFILNGDEREDQLFKYGEGAVVPFHSESLSQKQVSEIKNSNNKLIICFSFHIDIFNSTLDNHSRVYTYGSEIGTSIQPYQAEYESDGLLWIADERHGLIKNTNIWDNEQYSLNGPATIDAFNMDCHGSDVWVVPGGYDSDWAAYYTGKGIYNFIEKEWNLMSSLDHETLAGKAPFVSVAIDPENKNHVFIGTWNHGLIEILNNQIVQVFNKENSSLLGHVSEPSFVQVSGLAYDNQGNLWIVNSNSEKILHVYTKDKQWKGFNLGGSSANNYTQNVEIDPQGKKWVIIPRQNQIRIFDDNNTPLDTSDDDVTVLGGSSLPGDSKVFTVAFDDDGEAWIGSNKGPGVIYSTGSINSDNIPQSNRILINRNDGSGQADILLENEQINVIKVDPANRKWIGTENAGVFLMSDDGTDQIHHFTTENSPLLSNTILSMTLDDEGNVFFGTPKGIMSFHSDAIPPNEKNEIVIFPNPVRPEFSGKIAIQGLVKDADIKILDISGKLVYTGTAEGGQALWDGRNMNGVRVNSGVYLVFASDDEGTSTDVAKILFLK